MAYFLYFIFILLSIIGLCEAIYFLSLKLLYIKSDNKIIVCILKSKTADVELRFVVEQYKWLGRKYADKIFAVNALKNDEDVLNRCREIAVKNNITILEVNEINKIIPFEDFNES